MNFIKMNYELALNFNNYIDNEIKKYALFDNSFVDEYLYYSSDKPIQNEIINNYVYGIEFNNDYIGYIVFNIFRDESNKIGCNINPIIVFEKYRNKGYGDKILRYSFQDIIKEKIDYFECVVDKDNIKSYKMFIKNEFKAYTRKDNFIYLKKEKMA